MTSPTSFWDSCSEALSWHFSCSHLAALEPDFDVRVAIITLTLSASLDYTVHFTAVVNYDDANANANANPEPFIAL